MLPPRRKPAIFYLLLALPVAFESRVVKGALSPSPHYRIYQQSQNTEADPNDSYDVFYDQLSSEGRWIYAENYGYVFQPNIAATNADWRPYTNGHWESTDRGWYWDTEEPFGWATYHYGRWANIDGTGWVWTPGTDWSPAWVSWRITDNGYIGWAPLPPECPRPSEAVAIGPWCDSYSDLGPDAFCFLPVSSWLNPSYVGSLAPITQNLELINASRNVTNISVSKTLVSNSGPRVDLVAQEAEQPIKTYTLHYSEVRGRNNFGKSITGNVFNLNGPVAKLKANATKVPTVIKTIVRPTVNKGWNGLTKDDVDSVRRKYASEAHIPTHLPSRPIERVSLVPSQQAGGLRPVHDQKENNESKAAGKRTTGKGTKESEKTTGQKGAKAKTDADHKGAGKHRTASGSKSEGGSKGEGESKSGSKSGNKAKATNRSKDEDESSSTKKSSSSKSGSGKSTSSSKGAGGSKSSGGSKESKGAKSTKSSSGTKKKASEEKDE